MASGWTAGRARPLLTRKKKPHPPPPSPRFCPLVALIRSYRYFNNINRLAAKFPVAHTANPKDEVDVWCSNDYLGMSKSSVVVDTMT